MTAHGLLLRARGECAGQLWTAYSILEQYARDVRWRRLAFLRQALDHIQRVALDAGTNPLARRPFVRAHATSSIVDPPRTSLTSASTTTHRKYEGLTDRGVRTGHERDC